MPWNERPTSSTVKWFEAPEIVAPIKKNTKATRSYAIQQMFGFPDREMTHDRFSSKCVGKRGKRWLNHRRREKIGCSSPECLNTCTMEVMGDDWQSYGEGCRIQRRCQRGDGKGGKNKIESPSQYNTMNDNFSIVI